MYVMYASTFPVHVSGRRRKEKGTTGRWLGWMGRNGGDINGCGSSKTIVLNNVIRNAIVSYSESH